jgi:hypothetical protein
LAKHADDRLPNNSLVARHDWWFAGFPLSMYTFHCRIWRTSSSRFLEKSGLHLKGWSRIVFGSII